MALEAIVSAAGAHNDSVDTIFVTLNLKLRNHPERLYVANYQPPPAFITDEIITGGSSGAIAKIDQVTENYIRIKDRSNAHFADGEAITGTDSEATADIVKVGDREVLDQNITQVHNPANSISVAGLALLERMQEATDDYKRSQDILNSNAMAQVITYIQEHLEV